ncbi:hypothetical protein HK098_002716 [Nowakowskiella sp. JEL0407]|nr:hypothetical protein HK098_002716 [Nowakowskiella sp. JEL0407]
MVSYTSVLSIALFALAVVAQEPVFAPCNLSPALKASQANWDGAQIGLGACGRECVAEQNCYNCGSPNPLGDKTCLCKQSFHDDVLGCIDGSGAYCNGQRPIFVAYHTRVCVNNLPAAAPGSNPVSPIVAAVTTTNAVIRPPTTTLAALIPTTTARANTTTAGTFTYGAVYTVPVQTTTAASLPLTTAPGKASSAFINSPTLVSMAIIAMAALFTA